MKTRPIYLIFCYARSGGTFLNRYLANYDEFVILSEAHPIHNEKGGIHSVKMQMKKWYGVDITADNYVDQIIEAKNWCDINNKYLLIRDWSYIDYAESILNSFKPSTTPTNLELLKSYFEVNNVAFVRDGIDVYLSQGKNLKVFSKEYFDFANYLSSEAIDQVKYEDFVDSPDEGFHALCNILGLPSIAIEDCNDVFSNNVIGDINLSRGNQSHKVMKLKRRYAGFFNKKAINNETNLINANLLMNYPTIYESKETEGPVSHFTFQSKFFINKLKKKIQSFLLK